MSEIEFKRDDCADPARDALDREMIDSLREYAKLGIDDRGFLGSIELRIKEGRPLSEKQRGWLHSLHAKHFG